MGVLLAAVLVYLVLVKPAYEQVRTTGGLRPPATARTTPSTTQIAFPGVGDYTNVGGNVGIRINPDLLRDLFGGGLATPEPVQPVDTSDIYSGWATPLPTDFSYI